MVLDLAFRAARFPLSLPSDDIRVSVHDAPGYALVADAAGAAFRAKRARVDPDQTRGLDLGVHRLDFVHGGSALSSGKVSGGIYSRFGTVQVLWQV